MSDDRVDDDRRKTPRRRGERRAGSSSRALVPAGEVVDHAVPPAKPAAPEDPAFIAQMLAQGQIKRGLKGGPPVLSAARAAYLGAEYAVRDRRPPKGKTAVTDV